MTKISIIIPVGPFPDDQKWLDRCLASVAAQTRLPDEVLLIDDMAGLAPLAPDAAQQKPPLHMWRAPWRLGVGAAMNAGVALAENDLVFMLCADDYLDPECLELCLHAYLGQSVGDRDNTFYYVGVKYIDGRPNDEQFEPCGAAMVTKQLWRISGGFPPEVGSGAPDAALISIMLVHPEAGRIVGVARGKLLYNVNPHPACDSAKRSPWQGVILEARNVLTNHWEPPNWGRLA